MSRIFIDGAALSRSPLEPELRAPHFNHFSDEIDVKEFTYENQDTLGKKVGWVPVSVNHCKITGWMRDVLLTIHDLSF